MIRLTNALDAEKVLPRTISFRRVPLDIDLPYQSLYGMDGDVLTGKQTLRSRQFILEGGIYGSKDYIRQELDSILPFLMHPPIRVYHHHDRYLEAYALGAPQDWQKLGSELSDLRIPMIALDPYWYGQDVEVTVTTALNLTVDGTAPTYPYIKTLGIVSSLLITNELTDKAIAIDSSTAGTVEIDNANYTVKIADTNRLDTVNDDWLLEGFELLPGINKIETTTPITLVYRPRWL